MNATESYLITLVEQARRGDSLALGELLEKHRPWLRFLAERQLSPLLDTRFDASDIVQQTCLSVHRNIGEFDGSDPARFLSWLRRIHERNIQNAFRDHVRLKNRSVTREQSDAQNLVGKWGTAHTSSPSRRLMLGEDAVLLSTALESLTEDQRMAICLKFLDGISLSEISQQMDRSPDAVVSLVRRGLMNLRTILDGNTTAQTCAD